jgi:hypothetical protein
MVQMEIELTDPSKELSALGELVGRVAGGQSVIQGLSKCIGISLDDPEFLDVLAAIQRRIRDVEHLAKTADDSDFDEKMKSQVLSAVRNFAEFVHPKNANVNWDQLRSSMLSPNTITTLTFFSQTARRYRPLRVVPAEAREEVLTKLAETIQEVNKDKNLEEWMKNTLVEGLERIDLVLRHLQFFGHDVAITELLLAHHRFSIIGRAIETCKSNSPSFRGALLGISLAANLFVLPHDVIEALDEYKSWAPTWSNEVLKTITESSVFFLERRLLPPPAEMANEPPG